MLSHKASDPREAGYVTGLILRADAAATERGIEARVSRYAAIGDALTTYVRQVINTGGARDTKGQVRTPLASDSSVTFADVRDALSLRESGDTWEPPVTGTKPVGRTECQRYWEAASLSADHVSAAVVKLTKTDAKTGAKVLPENAKAIVEAAAVIKRDAALTPAEAAKRDTKRREREAAKSAKGDAAKRRDEWEAATYKLAADVPALVSAADIAAADDAALFATYADIALAIEERAAKREAAYAAEHEADAALAAIAAARGVSIDEMREMIDALAAAKLAARESESA